MADDKLTRVPAEGVLVERTEAVKGDWLYKLPTAPVELNSFETGWLMACVRPRAMNPNDATARGLYLKLKAASIANGVEWYYGDPPGLGDEEG